MKRKSTMITLAFALLFAVSAAVVYLTMPKGNVQAYVGHASSETSAVLGNFTVKVVDDDGNPLSGTYKVTTTWNESSGSKSSETTLTLGEQTLGVPYLDDNNGNQFFSFEGENVAMITIQEVTPPSGDYDPLPENVVVRYHYENPDGTTVFSGLADENVKYRLYVDFTNGSNAGGRASVDTSWGGYDSEVPSNVLTITYGGSSDDDPKLGNLVVKKELSGNDTDANKSFNFHVTLKDADDHPIQNKSFGTDTTDSDGKINFSLKGGSSKTITTLPDGTKYSISEDDYTGDGYDQVSWDKTPSGTIAGDTPDPSVVTFTATNTKNKQEPTPPQDPNPATIAQTLEKVVEGDKPESPGEFTFVLKSVFNTAEYSVEEMPMPEEASNGVLRKTFTGSGTHDLGEFTFTKEGKYTYELSEEDSAEDGYIYDETKYIITYDVTKKDGDLVAEATISDSDVGLVGNCTFINTYEKPVNDTAREANEEKDKEKVKKKSSKTDDPANILPYILALLTAGLVLGFTGKRRKND